jgi:lipoprotein-releasing system permease protein
MTNYRIVLSWRFLSSNKGNFFAPITAVIFGILLIHVNAVIFDGLWDGLIRDFSGYVYGDVFVMDDEDYITRSDSALVDFLEGFPLVEAATPRLYGIASMNATKNGKTIEEFRISLVGVKPVQDIRTSTVAEHVEHPQFIPTRSSIVLGEMVARDLGGLEIGDKVDVKIVDRWGKDSVKQFTVSNVASIYGAFGFNTYIHIDTLREMMDREGETDGILVNLYNREDTAGFIQVLKQYLKDDDYEIQELEEAADDILARVRSGISMIEPIGFFSLTSSGVIIFAIQTMAVSTKTRQIGIIRAIGGQRKDVLIVFLIQGIIIGGIGAVVGTVVGLGFGVFMDTADFRFGDDVSIPLEINHDWNKIAQTALTALLLSTLGALAPAFLATKISPIEAMRNK